MYLLRTGCFALLVSLSSQSYALFDPYYSQAYDIEYALEDEDESIRDILIRTFNLFMSTVTIDDKGEDLMQFNRKYYDSEPEQEN